MLRFRPLPWEYGVRNLLRRPGRSALTLLGLTIVVLLILVVTSFVRGLEATLADSGDARVGLVYALGSAENLEYSSVPYSTVDRIQAGVDGVDEQYGRKLVSPELYLGTQFRAADDRPVTVGLVRGVLPVALMVRNQVQITSGAWPQAGEVIVGRLAAAKLGWRNEDLAAGRNLQFEGQTWRISGHFSAGGSAFESEFWCPLSDLQQAMQRQDLSIVAVRMQSEAQLSSLNLFAKENRNKLEIESQSELEYYRMQRSHYGHVRILAWLVVGLIAGAGVFAGLNTMFGAVVGRIRELAALQTIGFLRRAITLSLVQEGTILTSAAALLAGVLALVFVNGVAIRFTMGAFALRVDSLTLLIGCGAGLLLGPLGSIPAAWRALRSPVVDALKSI